MNVITLDSDYLEDFLSHEANQIGVDLVSWSLVVCQGEGQIVVGSDKFRHIAIQAVTSLVREEDEGEGK